MILPNLTLLTGIQESDGYFFFDMDGAETLPLKKRNEENPTQSSPENRAKDDRGHGSHKRTRADEEWTA